MIANIYFATIYTVSSVETKDWMPETSDMQRYINDDTLSDSLIGDVCMQLYRLWRSSWKLVKAYEMVESANVGLELM